MPPVYPIYEELVRRKATGQKSFAVLVDPDKTAPKQVASLVEKAEKATVDFFLVGGSLVVSTHLDELITQLKKTTKIPVILFPGSPIQVSPAADALLYLSLISGRNPELLIGQHVISAPAVKKSGLEIIPTGYMVVDGGVATTVSYISHANPLPSNKNEIAVCTAMAGEMLGLKLIYLDAGSGALNPVPASMIKAVSEQIDVPLIVGGGITTPQKAIENCQNGADLIVVGNAIEKDIDLMRSISEAVHAASRS
ncbi:MAG: geranylgeranylglyceryl/heptaprenylglyceryl phosphate synthase [Bacteroidetes bacterium]|nr:geranylgeranylglyceryl/heptaprenylglyceryl phosphate synthase [Bacteroidota bacterium]